MNNDVAAIETEIKEVAPVIKGIIDADDVADFIAHNSGKRATVIREIAKVLNRNSLDNIFATPDFILAETMITHIEANAMMMVDRQKWMNL